MSEEVKRNTAWVSLQLRAEQIASASACAYWAESDSRLRFHHEDAEEKIRELLKIWEEISKSE